MQYCDLINLLALQFHDIYIFLTLILDRLKVHMVNRETMNKRTTEGELEWVLGVLYHPQNFVSTHEIREIAYCSTHKICHLVLCYSSN